VAAETCHPQITAVSSLPFDTNVWEHGHERTLAAEYKAANAVERNGCGQRESVLGEGYSERGHLQGRALKMLDARETKNSVCWMIAHIENWLPGIGKCHLGEEFWTNSVDLDTLSGPSFGCLNLLFGEMGAKTLAPFIG
jgi:hypothetical protein